MSHLKTLDEFFERQQLRKEALKIALRITGTCPIDHHCLPPKVDSYTRFCLICGWRSGIRYQKHKAP